jgi:hypothetical protein
MMIMMMMMMLLLLLLQRTRNNNKALMHTIDLCFQPVNKGGWTRRKKGNLHDRMPSRVTVLSWMISPPRFARVHAQSTE